MAERDKGRSDRPGGHLSRRQLLGYSAAFGTGFLVRQGLISQAEAASITPKATPEPANEGKRYDMKKSINLWALPYPDRMSLRQCLEVCKDAGFEGVELNFDLQSDLSPNASDDDLRGIRRMADDIGIEIAGVCSFLFWPYALTAADRSTRERGLELAKQMVHAAAVMGTEDLLVVPGAVYIPWEPDIEPVPNDVCDRRARDAVGQLVPLAEDAGVSLNIENIFVNGFLFSPQEMNAFVDSFDHPNVQVHFDTGNIMQYQFPEHWVPILGERIKHVHLKEFNQRVDVLNIETFRPLLDGSTNWPAVLDALEAVGYDGWLTFEYFNPFPHHPEALVYHTADAMDRMLGRK